MVVYDVSQSKTTHDPWPGKDATLREAALWYARRDILVFPCREGNKKPLTAHGFKDASSNEKQIHEWWSRWPNANIAMPTGNGRLVVDTDMRHGGYFTYDERGYLKAGDRFLPLTVMVKTPDGGIHEHYGYDYGLNSALKGGVGKLGEGVDVIVRGYVLLPPSRTGNGSYEWLSPPFGEGPIAEAPEWLLKALRERSETVSEEPVSHPDGLSVRLDGPIIKEGKRNEGLTRIAGKLHDGSRSLFDLEAALLAVNEKRCDPPLSRKEVKKVATSVYRYPSAKKAMPEVSSEALAALDAIELETLEEPERWRGRVGDTRFKIKMALVDHARRFGKMIATGVRVEISYRQLAEEAGCHRDTITNNIPEMKKAGELRADNLGRRADEAGAFVLPIPENARTSDTYPCTDLVRTNGKVSVGTVRALRRLRHNAPKCWRLGPRAGRVALVLARFGGEATIAEIAGALALKRPRDLRRSGGVLDRMREAGLIEVSGETVSFCPDWQTALDQAREFGGEIRAERRQKGSHIAEREAYAERRAKYLGSNPTKGEARK